MLSLCFKDGPILNFNTGNKSWWYANGIGCEPPTMSLDDGSSVASNSVEPVPGCFLQYYYVEVIHAGVQCLLSVSLEDTSFFHTIMGAVAPLLNVSP